MGNWTRPLIDLEGTVLGDKALPYIKTGTIYVEINLHISGRPPMTAIFLPEKFAATGPFDMILYLHGNTSTQSIRDYLNGRGLRKLVNDAGKNVVFVAPTLGLTAEVGDLGTGQGAFDYLDIVRRFMLDYGPFNEWPALGKVILAAHSGGGFGMIKLANYYNRKVSNPESWGFDCLYGAGTPTAAPEPLTVKEPKHNQARTMAEWERLLDGSVEKQWFDWVKQGHKFRAFWGAGGTLTRTANLDLLSQLKGPLDVEVNPNFFKTGDDGGVVRINPQPQPVSAHDLVPQTVLMQCIKDCPFLH